MHAAILTRFGEVEWAEWPDPRPGPGEVLVEIAAAALNPADRVRPRPAGWSWDETAALPLAGLTAWRALRTRGGLRSGSTVLITGAGSGVSTFLVQIGAALGARVLVTSSSDAKLAWARDLGAEGGADYRDPDWPNEIRRIAG